MSLTWSNLSERDAYPFVALEGQVEEGVILDLSLRIPSGGPVSLVDFGLAGGFLYLGFSWEGGVAEFSIPADSPEALWGKTETVSQPLASLLITFGNVPLPLRSSPEPPPILLPRCVVALAPDFSGFYLEAAPEDVGPTKQLFLGYNARGVAQGAEISFAVIPGAGLGLVPCESSEPMPVKTINDSGGIEGNILLVGQDCLRIVPPQEGGDHAPEHSLQIESDCLPCCDDDGYNRVAREVERVGGDIIDVGAEAAAIFATLNTTVLNLNQIAVARTPPMLISGDVKFHPAHITFTIFNSGSADAYGLVSLSALPFGFQLEADQPAKLISMGGLDSQIELLSSEGPEISDEEALIATSGAVLAIMNDDFSNPTTWRIGGTVYSNDPPPWASGSGDHRQPNIPYAGMVNGFLLNQPTFMKVWSRRGSNKGLAPGETVRIVLKNTRVDDKLRRLQNRIKLAQDFLVEIGVIELQSDAHPNFFQRQATRARKEGLGEMLRHIFVDSSNLLWQQFLVGTTEFIEKFEEWYSVWVAENGTFGVPAASYNPANTDSWKKFKTRVQEALDTVDKAYYDWAVEEDDRRSSLDIVQNGTTKDLEAAKNWEVVMKAIYKIQRAARALVGEDEPEVPPDGPFDPDAEPEPEPEPDPDEEDFAESPTPITAWAEGILETTEDDAWRSAGRGGPPPDGIYMVSAMSELVNYGFVISVASTFGGEANGAGSGEGTFACSSFTRRYKSKLPDYVSQQPGSQMQVDLGARFPSLGATLDSIPSTINSTAETI